MKDSRNKRGKKEKRSSRVGFSGGPLGFVAVLSLGVSALAVFFLLGGGNGESDGEKEPRLPRRAGYYAKRTSWTPVSGTTANVSHYVYRDINRDGTFDEGDRPMPGIAVRMTRPNGTRVVRRSNINGFVNFTNSMTASPVDVSEPGEYTFEVLVPDGWVLTSNNAVQTATYSAMPRTRPGIVADRVPEPAGLAPALVVEGKIASDHAGASAPPPDTYVRAVGPSGTKEDIPISRDGRFSFPAQPGDWALQVLRRGSDEVLGERSVGVDFAPVRLSTIVIGRDEPERATETALVDFEALAPSGIMKMPNGVAGLKWTNLIPVENIRYRGEGYINNTISGEFVAYNTSGYPVTIENEDGFDFRGAYFGVAWLRDAEGEILELRAWRHEELVGSEDIELSALGPVWFDADYRDITRLKLTTRHYWQFVTDDMVFGIRK